MITECQRIMVEQNEAAIIEVSFNPLFISSEELNRLMDSFSNLVAKAVADHMNREEARGAE